MRIIFFMLGLVHVMSANSQQPIWNQNKSFVDSLIWMYRTQSKCSLTGSTLIQEKKKRRLDIKLVGFLDRFYFGKLYQKGIEKTLRKKFQKRSWRFDQIRYVDSFTVYKGRVRSLGNFEPFITYVILNNELIGTHITIRIRSTLDCFQLHDREIPDLLYLSSFIPERINFPFEVYGWTEYFDSKIWMRKGLSVEVQKKLRNLIGNSSAKRWDLPAAHDFL